MFALHETTRRRWCRAGFVLLCAVPTLAIVAWTIWLRRPEHRDLLAQEIAQRLGVAVTLTGVRHPRPRLTLFEGIDLADPELGARLAHARLVELDASGDSLAIRTFQAEIDGARPAFLWELLSRELKRASGADRWSLSAGEVTLRTASGDQTLTDAALQCETTAEVRQATGNFRLAGYEMSEPGTLRPRAIGRPRPPPPTLS